MPTGLPATPGSAARAPLPKAPPQIRSCGILLENGLQVPSSATSYSQTGHRDCGDIGLSPAWASEALSPHHPSGQLDSASSDQLQLPHCPLCHPRLFPCRCDSWTEFYAPVMLSPSVEPLEGRPRSHCPHLCTPPTGRPSVWPAHLAHHCMVCDPGAPTLMTRK